MVIRSAIDLKNFRIFCKLRSPSAFSSFLNIENALSINVGQYDVKLRLVSGFIWNILFSFVNNN